MISVSRAQRLVLARTRPLPAVRVRLSDALNRVATRDIRAPFDLPRYTASSMDGHAVASHATRGASAARPVRLRILRRAIFAGSRPGKALPAGAAVRIMTGAPIPVGTDAVIPLEEARVERGALVVMRPVRAGSFVRRAAEDCRKGDIVVPRGTRVHAGAVALLSILGIRRVVVRRAPRVAIVVTGSEVRLPTARPLPPYAVWDSHAAFLTAALKELGIRPGLVSYARDRAVEIRSRLAHALARADIVVVTGGISVGERDLVRPALASLRVRTVFWGVAQQPGKPLYFGLRRGVAVLGLPGNPASAVVCYCEYVRPALRRMLGDMGCMPEEWSARLVAPVPSGGTRARFLRGHLRGNGGAWRVTVARRQGSNLLGSFLASDCLVIVPAGARRPLRAGAEVRVHPLPWRRT